MNSYESWKIRSPRLLDPVLCQKIRCCWTIGITRQLTAFGRHFGFLDDKESLSIQYLLNGVDKMHLNQEGAINDLLNAKSFLVNEGTVLEVLCPLDYQLNRSNQVFERNVTKFKVGDLIVHRPEEYENVSMFHFDIRRCLNQSPVAIAIPTYESFNNIGNVIYLPKAEERRSHYVTYHVMLLTGCGIENGMSYWEVQDSAGEQQGQGGYVKIASDFNIISHMVEIKQFYCTPVNPKTIFNKKIPFNQELYISYIDVSYVHARMLAKQDLITGSEEESILKGLGVVRRNIASNTFQFCADPDDVQLNIETAVANSLGELAKKLRRAYSVNDQGATVFRLWCRKFIDEIIGKIRHLQVALVLLADQNKTLIIPSYTSNFQRAQSVILSQLLLAYVEKFDRDAIRYHECRMRLNVCPLGVCAVAGTYLPINRSVVAEALEFTEPMRNSIDAVSDRDFVVDLLHANSTTAGHLSGLGQDWVLWASEKFGFMTPSGSVLIGCSIMQQNYPHPMELVIKKAATVKGCLNSGVNFSGLAPLTYDQDFQEDRALVFDSFKTTTGMIDLSVEFVKHVTFNKEAIKKSLPSGHLNDANLVTYLVEKKGLSHIASLDLVDQVVEFCVSACRTLESLSVEELKQWQPAYFGDDLNDYMNTQNSVKFFRSDGSTGPDSVDRQLGYWIGKLGLATG